MVGGTNGESIACFRGGIDGMGRRSSNTFLGLCAGLVIGFRDNGGATVLNVPDGLSELGVEITITRIKRALEQSFNSMLWFRKIKHATMLQITRIRHSESMYHVTINLLTL